MLGYIEIGKEEGARVAKQDHQLKRRYIGIRVFFQADRLVNVCIGAAIENSSDLNKI
ncbi:hypothetical protein [Siminovitchia fordii]|uniref:hypothetical protein n=1 Tax=Siminovitchia fordii TaxID=254759 RepID=UPI00037E6611|nr:hypothetical protein [Siminovitchia fordii]